MSSPESAHQHGHRPRHARAHRQREVVLHEQHHRATQHRTGQGGRGRRGPHLHISRLGLLNRLVELIARLRLPLNRLIQLLQPIRQPAQLLRGEGGTPTASKAIALTHNGMAAAQANLPAAPSPSPPHPAESDGSPPPSFPEGPQCLGRRRGGARHKDRASTITHAKRGPHGATGGCGGAAAYISQAHCCSFGGSCPALLRPWCKGRGRAEPNGQIPALHREIFWAARLLSASSKYLAPRPAAGPWRPPLDPVMSGDGRSGAGRGGKKGKRTAARPTAKSPPATPGAPAWQLVYRRKIRRLGGLGTDARPDAAYDSSCFECNDGGEVVCCATCNRVCHPGCMSPPRRHIPDSEEWKCGQCLVRLALRVECLGVDCESLAMCVPVCLSRCACRSETCVQCAARLTSARWCPVTSARC